MKKWIAVLLAVSVCLGICACGQQEGTADDSGKKQPVPEVGKLYSFGTYGQSEIQWQVLAVEGDKALLLSQCALDAVVYHEDWDDTTWETCTLRAWLNGKFLNEAFTAAEQERILTTAVPAEANPTYPTNPGNATEDKLFLLSIGEVQTYMHQADDRKCGVTEYAAQQGVWVNEAGHCSWWLRTPGNLGDNAVYISSSGNIDEIGDDVIYSDHGVRPAFWISING